MSTVLSNIWFIFLLTISVLVNGPLLVCIVVVVVISKSISPLALPFALMAIIDPFIADKSIPNSFFKLALSVILDAISLAFSKLESFFIFVLFIISFTLAKLLTCKRLFWYLSLIAWKVMFLINAASSEPLCWFKKTLTETSAFLDTESYLEIQIFTVTLFGLLLPLPWITTSTALFLFVISLLLITPSALIHLPLSIPNITSLFILENKVLSLPLTIFNKSLIVGLTIPELTVDISKNTLNAPFSLIVNSWVNVLL
ncbi:hypothetical protein MYMA111404_04470 [Mycoplasma marinum]